MPRITRCAFQSAPLMRGETRRDGRRRCRPGDFNPLPSCEGRPLGEEKPLYSEQISIHSPHARGDGYRARLSGRRNHFNPLPSCEGRPFCVHSPPAFPNFNPLPSRKGRPARWEQLRRLAGISIHSPHARGDSVRPFFILVSTISIHSPHARGDKHARTPGGGTLRISIHSPHARGDFYIEVKWDTRIISIHSPHARGDGGAAADDPGAGISIHSPHARGDLLKRLYLRI